MRSTGKTVLILITMLLASMLAAGQAAPTSAAPAKGKTVEKRGKVEAGVEAGCLVLRDTRDHKLYNVLFRDKEKPNAGEEISFSGTLHEGPTTCMEGIPLAVTSWKPVKTANPKTK